ncbi:CAP domain-containing protein [Cohnella sp.]|uniref:CAP domain-containing protein n=1 Tax=Cohnella sp. TaxID=1883426 RepID=UPI003565E665
MNKQQIKGLKKTLILGTLALALSIPVGTGAASAASTTPTISGNMTITQLSARLGIDLNALLQQYLRGNYPIVSKPATGTGNNDAGQVTQPTKPVIQQPSKPAIQQPTKPVTQPSVPAQQTQGNNTGTDTAASTFATQVVTLVNQERAKAGLSALKTTNATLKKMALDKAKDIYHKGYFAHNSPTYGSPFDMMKQYGISFRYAGENIAKGQRTPQEVMTAWMNSPGHRANILSANFTTIGVAYYNGVWVQEFIA